MRGLSERVNGAGIIMCLYMQELRLGSVMIYVLLACNGSAVAFNG